MIKLHELQQGLEALGIFDDIFKASLTGGSTSVITGGAGTWGSITGTLANQLDLQAALDAKENLITAGDVTQYYRGDKTFQTLDTSVVPENTNLYYTDARVETFSDGRYSLLGHIHDDRYYTETEIDTLLTGYSLTTHNHDGVYLKISENLADLNNVVTARTNLGLGTMALETASNYYTSAQVDTLLDGKVDANVAITGATKTKITYDAKGLVTAGADATTADINDSTDRRYVTDAQLVVIGNTSGTNTGDQTSIVGITGTKAEFNTALTDGDFLFVGDITQYTDEMAQDTVFNAIVDGSGINTTYDDGANTFTIENTGVLSITGTANQVIASAATGAVTLSLPQDIGTGSSPRFTDLTLSGLTGGSVLFSGPDGEISEDNAQLFWNDTDNYFGVGTNTPGEKVEIAGNLRFSEGATRNITVEGASSGAGNHLMIKGGAGGLSSIGGNLYLDGGAGNVAANGNVLLVTQVSGNVGIGVSPSAKLHVAGGNIRFDNGNTNQGLLFGNGQYGFIDFFDLSSSGVRFTGLGPLRFGSNTNAAYGSSTFTEHFRITTDGHVGMGTGSPGLIAWGGPTLTIQGTANRSAIELANTNTSTTGTAGTIAALNGSTRLVQIDMRADGATNRGGLFIYTNKAGTLTTHMVLDSNGYLSVGALATPSNQLHLAGVATASSVRIDTNGLNPDRGMFLTTLSSNAIMSNCAEYTASGWTARNTVSSQLQLAGGLMRFYTDSGLTDNGTFTPTERMRLDTSGNLGIGTTTIDTKLHIVATDGTGAVTLGEESTTPANPDNGTEARIYVKSDKLVIQFNNAGTVRYKYLDLTGTGVTWVHTTTAP